MVWITSILSARSSTRTSSLRTSYCVLEMPTSGVWLPKPQSGSSQGPSPHPARQVPRTCVGAGIRTLDLSHCLITIFFLSPTPVSTAPQEVLVSSFPVSFSHPSQIRPCPQSLALQLHLFHLLNFCSGTSKKLGTGEQNDYTEWVICFKLPLVTTGPTTTSVGGYCSFPNWLLQADSSRAGGRQETV